MLNTFIYSVLLFIIYVCFLYHMTKYKCPFSSKHFQRWLLVFSRNMMMDIAKTLADFMKGLTLLNHSIKDGFIFDKSRQTFIKV